MRLLISEWCCSGGLHGPDAGSIVAAGADVVDLSREGRSMFRALLADAARDGGFAVTALIDEASRIDVPAGARVRLVPRGMEVEALVEEAGRADAVLVVAPESEGILAARVAAVRAAGGIVIAPGAGFIRIASDKQATIDALAAAGVPVPAGRSLAAGVDWPRWFRVPAVRKARAGTGCDGLLIVRQGDPPPPPAPVPTRLEAFVPGIPVGVSCIDGGAGPRPLPPLRQRFSGGPDMRYAGGEPLGDPGMRSRASALAERAIAAVIRAAGEACQACWVGVDMILGDRPDGGDDRVLEINPRLTTSFVGLSRPGGPSLVRALADAAAGRAIRFPDLRVTAFTLDDDDERLREPL